MELIEQIYKTAVILENIRKGVKKYMIKNSKKLNEKNLEAYITAYHIV